MTGDLLGVAFPYREVDREELRRRSGRSLPKMRVGSHRRRCVRCNLELLVGPRLQATGLRVVCPTCATHLGMTGFWPAQ